MPRQPVNSDVAAKSRQFVEAIRFQQVKCVFDELFVSYLPLLAQYTSNTMQDNQKPAVSSTTDLQREVAELMVECLNLEVAAGGIIPDAPLYGEGLGLDSIDVLEVALVVSKRYGLQLRTDSADNQQIFSSLRSLSDYIAAQRTL